MEDLVTQLDSYSRLGIPKVSIIITIQIIQKILFSSISSISECLFSCSICLYVPTQPKTRLRKVSLIFINLKTQLKVSSLNLWKSSEASRYIMFTSSALYSLEDDWTDIVEGHADLSEQLKYSITHILQLSHLSFFLTLTWNFDFLLSLLFSISYFHFPFHPILWTTTITTLSSSSTVVRLCFTFTFWNCTLARVNRLPSLNRSIHQFHFLPFLFSFFLFLSHFCFTCWLFKTPPLQESTDCPFWSHLSSSFTFLLTLICHIFSYFSLSLFKSPPLQESTDCLMGADFNRACLHKNSQSDPGCEFNIWSSSSLSSLSSSS